MNKYKRVISIIEMFLVISIVFSISFSLNSNIVNADTTVGCCEKTKSGEYCQTAAQDQCEAGSNFAPTSCEQTSYCKSGCCAGIGGYCYNNYPKALCEKQYGGSYSADPSCNVQECNVGCCVIGTQASILTKGRCLNETSRFPDLELDFRADVQDESSCLNLAKNTEKGCCVSDSGCSYGAKSTCNVPSAVNGTGFYKDKFCGSLNGMCSCAPADHTTGGKGNTMCLPNDDSVYWKDSCGNPEGIKEKCDYSKGSLCGDSDKDGIFSCESLKCEGQDANSENSKKLSVNLENYHGTDPQELKTNEILNGESWCQSDSSTQDANKLYGQDPVGSRYYRSICINGKELVEPCKDYRQEFCYSANVDVPRKDEQGNEILGGIYTEGRCLKNEWQSCIDSCNTADSFTMSKGTYEEALKKDEQCCGDRTKRDCAWTGSKCAPAVSPGAKFWEGEGSDTCGKANLECTAMFVCGGWSKLLHLCSTDNVGGSAAVAGLGGTGAGVGTAVSIGAVTATSATVLPIAASVALASAAIAIKEYSKGGSAWRLVHGKECFSQDYLQAGNNLCRSFGDCGADYNYLVDDVNVPDNLKLTKSGFSNTGRIKEDLAKAVRNDDEKHGLTYDYGKGVDKVPGNLSANPDWGKGNTFFNFENKQSKTGPNKGFVKALYFGDFKTGLLPTLGGGLLLGLASAYFASAPLGQSAGIGLGSTPQGLLLRGVLGFIPKLSESTFGSGIEGLVKADEQNAINDIILDKGSEIDIDLLINHPNDLELAQKAIRDKAIKDAGTSAATDEAKKKVGDEAIAKATEEAKKKVAEQSTASATTSYLAAANAAMWAYSIYQIGDTLLAETHQVTVSTTCQPWQAPAVKTADKDQCEKCNPSYTDYLNNDKTPKDVKALKGCSEYRCKSLGASCDLVNKGSIEEQCVSLSKYDVNSPVIKPWKEGFSKELQGKIQETNSGLKITGEVKIYDRFLVGLQTDEPAQCKMSFDHSVRYPEMQNIYFMSNTFKYYHAQQMYYPATKNATADGLKLTGGGNYKVYIRCQDAVGNVNEKDYEVEFDVSKEPDFTAPTIVGTNFGQETYLRYGTNRTDVTLYVNEPADCKWSTTPLDYKVMPEQNKCVASRLNSLGYYECQNVGERQLGAFGPGINTTGMKSGENKFVYFKCQDKSENKNYDKEAFRLTLKGSEPLEIKTKEPSGVIKTSQQQANLTIKVITDGGALLNGNANCKYTQQESLKNNLGSMTPFLQTNSSIHIQPWSPPTGRQDIYVGCEDTAGNSVFTNINFTIENDVVPPSIVKIYTDESLQPPVFTIELNEKAVCKDSTIGTFDYETEGNLMIQDGNVQKTSTPGSSIYYVSCKDEFGNKLENARIQFA